MKINLSEIIDLAALQKLMESLYQATGINHALIDNQSNVLTAVGWQKLCTDFHRQNPQTCERCLISDRYILEHLNDGPYVGYKCPNGLHDYCTPVRIGGEHVANIFTGQMFHQPPDISFFRDQAKEFGFDEEAYLEAVSQVKIIPENQMPAVMVFLSNLATMVGEMGLMQLKQKKYERELEKKIAERTAQLQESETQFRELFANSPDATWIIDENNLFTLCNAAAARILEYDSSDQLQSTHPSELSPEFQTDGKSSLDKANEMMSIARQKGVHRFEWMHRRRSGSTFPVEVTLSRLKIKGKEHLYCIWRDITQRIINEHQLQEMNKKLQHLTVQDGLTGIGNRRMFDTTLAQEWTRCMRSKSHLSLVMIDIDFFKEFNDFYGHLSGDNCLKMIAHTLSKTLKRSVDLCARYGGEEFALLLPDTNLAAASKIAEECCKQVLQLSITHPSSRIGNEVTISAGVSSVAPTLSMQAKILVKSADQALYQAKNNGRNRVEKFEPEI